MWPWNASTMGEVYLFHFNSPLGNLANPRAQAMHYVGFADDLDARIAKQLAGKGAKLVAAALKQGLIFEIYHWPAPLATEKLVKRAKNTARFCPACCAAAGRTPRPLPTPPPFVQLALPLTQAAPVEECEPWPEGFEFPAPTRTKTVFVEWQAERAARAVRFDNGDLDHEDIPF